jgi:hypothetical protein
VVLIGVSLGAISAIPVAALEEDVDGLVSILGGGDLHRLLPALEPFLGSQSQSFLAPATAKDLSEVEPLRWARALSPDRVLLMRAAWDHVSPGESSQLRREGLGVPREYVFPSGHFSFAAFLPAALEIARRQADTWCRIGNAEPLTR